MLSALVDLQDIETVGPSAVVPGIVIKLEPWPASAHAIRKVENKITEVIIKPNRDVERTENATTERPSVVAMCCS